MSLSGRLSHRSIEPPEVVVPADPSVPPLTAVKGILLHSSQEGLRALGHYARYAALLGEEPLALLTTRVSNEWIPVEDMDLHYGACDALTLSNDELDAMGRWVVQRLQNRLLSSLTSAARGAGYDPWLAFPALIRLSGRVFRGSHAELRKLGPKDIELTVHGNPLLRHTYFRSAFFGTVRGMFGLLGARSVYVNALSTRAPGRRLALHVAWV